MTKQAIIGIGSNLNGPAKQVQHAVDRLSQLTNIALVKQSSLYTSSPQGPQDQQDFCNAVVLVQTELSAVELLLELQALEAEFGRIKTRHWGERIIDLDIIFYGQDVVEKKSPDLVIPHPFALKRDFVLIPTLEIAPEWVLPDGTPLVESNHKFDSHNLRKLSLH